MEQAAKGALDEIVAKETWTFEDQKELVSQLYQVKDAPRRFRAILEGLESADAQPKGGSAVKIGIANYMLCRFGRALDVLSNATDNKERRFFQALCYKSMRQYDKALEDLDRAKDRGWDGLSVDVQAIEIKALSGDPEGARKALGRLERHSASADYKYLSGLIEELSGNGEKAAALYEQARHVDPRHGAATFRLAYYLDLHGQEDRALELYRQCLNYPPVHANALINLAVLYDDLGRYEQAMSCLRRVLVSMPNHPRARLFLKDADASKVMFYDEDQAKRVARRNAVLDIPVTDFELSVRAELPQEDERPHAGRPGPHQRHRAAGLQEFWRDVAQGNQGHAGSQGPATGRRERRGRRIRRSCRASRQRARAPAAAGQGPGRAGHAPGPGAVLHPPRKAVESLNVATLGELAQKTEAELLACKNFGQTSLNEIVQRLGEHGLHLKESL